MDHVVKIEVTVGGDSARLYELFSEAAESVTPGQLNRAILETGLVHHALMLTAIGMIPEENRQEVYDIGDQVGKRTIMRDLFEQAREHWQSWSDAGSIQPNDLPDGGGEEL